MLILGIDCSEKTCSAALLLDGEIIGSATLNSGLTHSENLIPLINGLTELTGKSCGEIDLYAVAAGPGSFTGVRIGVSTVKGLAFAGNTPCIGLSSLLCMAYGFTGRETVVCPVMDARRGQVYGALFGVSGDTVRRLTPDSALPAEELAGLIPRECGGKNVIVCGGGAGIMLEACRGMKNVLPAPPELIFESGASVALAALDALRSGAETFPGGDGLRPVYLRPSQAERTKTEREAKS